MVSAAAPPLAAQGRMGWRGECLRVGSDAVCGGGGGGAGGGGGKERGRRAGWSAGGRGAGAGGAAGRT